MAEVQTRNGGLSLIARQPQPEAATPPHASRNEAEASLVEAVREGGDHDAFERLYRLYAPMVHGILLARVPYDEVADLVQDVFLIAYRKIGTLRDGAAFGGWLAMIARNRSTDFHRQTRRGEELPDDVPHHHPPEAEAAEILAVIRALPEAYREPLILRLVEGMTGEEIAGRTGMKHASVRVNLHRGMKMLRTQLGLEQ